MTCGVAFLSDELHCQGTACMIVCVILLMSVITQDGDSALMRAAYYGETEVVVKLVKAGADLNLQNKVCLNVIRI